MRDVRQIESDNRQEYDGGQGRVDYGGVKGVVVKKGDLLLYGGNIH